MKTSKDIDLPGDEYIPVPRKTITHSIVINDSPEKIWPWLVQLGSGRAGWYSYDKIDNGGTPSSLRILPEYQVIKIGDIMPAVPGSKDSFIIRKIDVNKTLVLVVPVKMEFEEPDNLKRMMSALRVSWTLHLEPLGVSGTRLYSIGRISDLWLAASPKKPGTKEKAFLINYIYKCIGEVPWWLMQPFAVAGHYFMERRMLKGIKQRVERLQSNPG